MSRLHHEGKLSMFTNDTTIFTASSGESSDESQKNNKVCTSFVEIKFMELVYIYVAKIIKLCYEPCSIEYEPELIKTGESCFRHQILSIPVELPIKAHGRRFIG